MMPGTNESSELGMKVKIMLDWDLKGKQGPMTPFLIWSPSRLLKKSFQNALSMALKKTWSQL
jgi:hypothetical protein